MENAFAFILMRDGSVEITKELIEKMEEDEDFSGLLFECMLCDMRDKCSYLKYFRNVAEMPNICPYLVL